MATNKVGNGTKTIGINMPSSMAKTIEDRAKSIGITTSKFVRIVLKEWIDSKKKIVLAEK